MKGRAGRFVGVLALTALVIGAALAAQLVIPAAATRQAVEDGKESLVEARAEALAGAGAELGSTELTQGFVLEVLGNVTESQERQLGRSMQAVERVAVSADVGQTTTSLTSMCWPVAIVALCVTAIYFDRRRDRQGGGDAGD